MRNILLLLILLFVSSCATISMLEEDKLFQTRKYVGLFVDYRHVKPEQFGDPHLVWIKTTEEDIYGKICLYSRKCEFQPGEWLYIRRTYYNPGGVSGYWIYQIEGDKSGKFYRLSKFQYDNKILVQTWF